ncbi:MAG: type I-E CRISPR-associated protein Cse1/CasA [Methanolinea sp.]|nr:type I-E CRISPR-associated protein Cse1/CasA [Methanolinea sp.]
MPDRLLNLVEDPWIPCLTEKGERLTLAPWQVFEHWDDLGPASLATVRPDFQGSIVQFLIGLVQTTMPPRDDAEWTEALEEPPDPSRVRGAFASVAHAFNLGGEGLRFMQDPTCADGEKIPIESLVIGMPGDNTLRENRDLFNKRGSVKNLCPACAALALMTLQINGPQGGKGHMTGLRGGGPLTTLVLGGTLGETVWLNVLPEDEFFLGLKSDRKEEIHDIFPWMGPIRTSERERRGQKTGISNASQLQMFWGMGRRILLDTEKTQRANCDVCGEETDTGIGAYRTKPYGIQYDESWRHVLTPYRRDKKSDAMLPVHLSPEGITYRHWLGIVQNDPEEGREIARVIQRFHRVGGLVWGLLPRNPRIWAFGYDFEKVKARCWYDSTMPLVLVSKGIRESYESSTAQIVRAAQYVSDVLHHAVREALYATEQGDGKQGRPQVPDSAPKNIPTVRARFWSETEPLFYRTLGRIKDALEAGEPVEPVKVGWVKDVRRTVLSLYDFYAQFDYIDSNRPKAVAGARKRLAMMVAPGAKNIAKILALPREAET